MSTHHGIARILCAFAAPKQWLRSRLLSREEALMIERYRTLSEMDQIAMRYLFTAVSEVSRF
ncbi:hypothetical protein [Pseudomonas fontis]|uniref:Uncharacterized protein n=1 Tax=Pseudomonas fontis TaxID=2942633 RepID=A0ABT5NY13_9PSED|nr:hypothetical protein [Pseudomonas fontis]MDD0977464.1 hypothetical protein [Pseudomonas fontis]MDD0993084.1 hypothetical protein [Pseudomonas fontis]